MIENQAVLDMVRRVKDDIAQNPGEGIMPFDRIPLYESEAPEVFYSRRQMKEAVERLMAGWRLVPERNIDSDKPGVRGKAITAMKKAVRKSLRFYIEPICEQQSELNHMFACGFRQFALAFTDMMKDRDAVEDLERRLAALERKIKPQEKRWVK